MLRNPNAAADRESFEKFDQDIPDSLWPPEFVDGAQQWYQAFADLSSDRPQGMGMSRIGFMAAYRYAETMGIDDFDGFWRCVRAMDDVFIDHHSGEKQIFTREQFRGAFASK